MSTPDSGQLGENTLQRLFEISTDVFKQQLDKEESIWRTMPILSALFGLSFPIIRSSSTSFSFEGPYHSLFADLIFLTAMASFVLAFVYATRMVLRKEFEHPAEPSKIMSYAFSLSNWHRDNGEHHSRIDKAVSRDILRLSVQQLASANDTNRKIVEARLAARSKAVLLLMAGFAMVSASEMIIFVGKRFG